MQHCDEKTLHLTKELGTFLSGLREQKTGLSLTKFAYSYDINSGNLSKIENGLINCKFITLWRISEALGMKPSDLIRAFEEHLGEDFKLIDE